MHKEFQGGGLRVPKILYALIVCVFYLLLKCVNGRGRFGGQTAGGQPKASPRPRQPPFAAPALRELESACRVGIF